MRPSVTILQITVAALFALLPLTASAQQTHPEVFAKGDVRHGTKPDGHDDHEGDHPAPREFVPGTVKFTQNLGQIIDNLGSLRPDVLYTAALGRVTLYFAKDRISYVYRSEPTERAKEFARRDWTPDPEHRHPTDLPDGTPHPDSLAISMHRVDMELLGANPEVRVESQDVTTDYNNYYLGHCPQGILGVRSYRRLIYREIYPNIDMVIASTDKGTKYDFVVRPGGRVSDIRIRYTGADAARLMPGGSLRVTNPLGFIEESSPFSYQGYGAAQHEVRSRFVLRDGVLGFAVDNYDPWQTLVIDPTQEWATFWGGTGSDQIIGGDPTEVDRQGNCFIAGYTTSTNAYLATPGAFRATNGGGTDAIVVKFDAFGNVVFSTYYGGSGGGVGDIAHGVTADANGNIFITGHTDAANLPMVNAFQGTYGGNRDAFAAKFTTSGVCLWSTYSGGSNFDDGYAFAVDSSGNVVLTVTSGSSSLTGPAGPVTYVNTKPTAAGNAAGNYDLMLLKYAPAGTVTWVLFHGGSQTEYAYSAASDVKENILLTGWTNSANFPLQNAAQPTLAGGYDAFVLKFNKDGVLRWGTFLGGTGTENSGFGGVGFSGMATDYDGNVFVTGTVQNGTFPTTPGAAWPAKPVPAGIDAWLAKYDSNGVKLWATYFGGAGSDYGIGAASNTQGSVLICGYTNSANLPVNGPGQDPPEQAAISASNDAFVVKLDKDGKPKWVTYFGETGDDQAHGISYDVYGSIAFAGETTSGGGRFSKRSRQQVNNGLPVAQAANNGTQDMFMTLFCDPEPPRVDSSGPKTFCNSDSVIVWIVPGYRNVKWYKVGTPNIQVGASDSLVIKETGRFFVQVENVTGCVAVSDTINTTKLPRVAPAIAPSPAQVCTGDTITLTASAPVAITSYLWVRQATGDTVSRIQTAKVFAGGTYWAYVVSSAGCRDSISVLVNEYPKPTAVVVASDTAICEDDVVALTATGGTGGSITWFRQGNATSIGGGATYNARTAGVYYATATTPNGCFTTSNRVTVRVNLKPRPKIVALTPVSFCEGDSAVLDVSPTAGDAVLPGFRYPQYDWSTGATTKQIVVKQSGDIRVIVTDTNGCKGEATITVTKNPKPAPRLTVTPDTIVCEGDSVVISAGSGYNGYAWNNGSTDPAIKVGRLGQTTYWCTVTTTEGCQGTTDSVTITVRPRPTAQISGAEAVCTNTPAQYSVPSASGVTYTWTLVGPSGTITSGAGTNVIDVGWGAAGANKVIVMVTDNASGCKAYDTLDVTVGSILVPNITGSRSPLLCPGDSIVLDAGPGYSKYTWSTGAGSRTIVVKAPGSYSVTVENAGGCSGTSRPFDVQLATPPAPKITPSRSLSLCPGDTVELVADPGYADYQWSNGASIQRLKISASGVFRVVVTDTNGCRGVSDSVVVVMNTPPAPVVAGPNSVCINSTENYTATGNPGDTYQWVIRGPGGTIQSGQGTGAISVQWTAAGDDTLEVTVTDAATGCKGTVEYIVSVGTSLRPTVTATNVTFCDSTVISAPAGYRTYTWAPGGETSQSITVRTSGTYTVTVTDAGGCSGSGSITVSQKPPFKPSIALSAPGFCPGDSVQLTASAGYASYLWAPDGQTTQSIWVKNPGAYTVTVRDADSCVGVSDNTAVVGYPAPVLRGIVQIGDDLTADVDTVSGPKISAYQWYQDGNAIIGGTGPAYRTTVVGDYQVRVTTVDGCTMTSPVYRPTASASSDLEVPVLSGAPGERVQIPLRLTASQNLDRNQVSNYEARLRFNKSILWPAEAGMTSVIDNADRVVTVKGARPIGTTSGDLIRLEFITMLGDADQTPLTLESFRWLDTANGSVVVTLVSGSFTVNNVCVTGGKRLIDASGAVRLKPARPNPVSGIADIEYEVVEQGHTRLYLVDVYGNYLTTVVDADIAPGSYVVQIDASTLPSGSYVCVLQTPTQRMSQVLRVAH